MSTTYARTLDKLAALATAPSAADNERAVSREKFDRVAARHGITKTVEEWVEFGQYEVGFVQDRSKGPFGAFTYWTADGKHTNGFVEMSWNPARFQHAPCPHGCGTLVYLVPKWKTKRTFIGVLGSKRRSVVDPFLGGEHTFTDLIIHFCPVVVAKDKARREREIEESRARSAAWHEADKAEKAADPVGYARRERDLRREIATMRRRDDRAATLAAAAADKATHGYWRRAEAAVERTRRWRAANPDHARRLNREAQQRHRDRVKAAKAATGVVSA